MKAFSFSLGAILFFTLQNNLANSQVTPPPLQEITEHAGQCNWCLVANTSYVYCKPQNKCYNRAPSGGVTCTTAIADLFTNNCGSDVCTESITIPDETTRKANYLTVPGNTDTDPAYLLYGTVKTITLTPNNRCSVTFVCPDALELCTLTMENTAGNNMRAYILSSTTITNEGVIKQEINTFGTMSIRRTSVTLMFVSLDWLNDQTFTITYVNALLGKSTGLLVFALIASILSIF